MDRKKLIILIILSIFIVGIVMGQVSATHKVKIKQYEGQISDKEYKTLKKWNRSEYEVNKGIKTKTKNTASKKVPKYKSVTKNKWHYKKVLSARTVYYKGGYDSVTYNLKNYYKNGWKYYGSVEDTNGDVVTNYVKLKKKIPTKVKVLNGYKTVKKPYKMLIRTDVEKRGFHVTVFHPFTKKDVAFGVVRIK